MKAERKADFDTPSPPISRRLLIYEMKMEYRGKWMMIAAMISFALHGGRCFAVILAASADAFDVP